MVGRPPGGKGTIISSNIIALSPVIQGRVATRGHFILSRLAGPRWPPPNEQVHPLPQISQNPQHLFPSTLPTQRSDTHSCLHISFVICACQVLSCPRWSRVHPCLLAPSNGIQPVNGLDPTPGAPDGGRLRGWVGTADRGQKGLPKPLLAAPCPPLGVTVIINDPAQEEVPTGTRRRYSIAQCQSLPR